MFTWLLEIVRRAAALAEALAGRPGRVAWVADQMVSYYGRLQTPQGEVLGVVEWLNGRARVILHNPPAGLFSGEEGLSLTPRGPGWWLVNDSLTHRSVRSAIRAVEAYVRRRQAELGGVA